MPTFILNIYSDKSWYIYENNEPQSSLKWSVVLGTVELLTWSAWLPPRIVQEVRYGVVPVHLLQYLKSGILNTVLYTHSTAFDSFQKDVELEANLTLNEIIYVGEAAFIHGRDERWLRKEPPFMCWVSEDVMSYCRVRVRVGWVGLVLYIYLVGGPPPTSGGTRKR